VSALCDVAITAIATAFTEGVRRAPELRDLDDRLRTPGASFVTLEHGPELLGCVGALEASQPLGIDIAEHALAAAFDDPRMPPLSPADFPVMAVKVSVLSTPEPLAVTSFAQLRAVVRTGIDGLTVELPNRRATLLPSVWEKVRDPDDFLDALWHKAGLPPRAWPAGLQVSRYTTTEECDRGPRAPV
jgi:uncharacterized protein